ncbi:ATP-dependent helicase HrpB [Rhizobium sp. TRM95796]|uniref:ATP-dependent helicase HrpB n=1 Tax=Rhizobium sp. TRM95796 TaxID=2979862 RepID=UPI0021E75C32|nr:ATP-dependent helicase HrpB [Rhizobium sp. TRM95796]MCV3767195.1 ATP-dependent helicase HrpB [Rhizobium sp. TRM95796]
MPFRLPHYPVSEVLDDIASALTEAGRAVVSAPPGAGKTTLVPLHLLDAPWRGDGKIILLEPRRLAARAAARRMAALIGEEVGGLVGYRMRLDQKISGRTRIEVVTEGVFARMILDDPELSGTSCVIFDEFHERSLDADLGLALALDVQGALREDLRILVMSATLDIARIAGLMNGAPEIESLGRGFPIDIRHQDRDSSQPIEDVVARVIAEAHRSEEGSILAFLPGQREIIRTAERLQGRFGAETIIAPLYGALSQAEQDLAIKPAPPGQRKIVLATSIAETSITIDGVRIVVDSGLQRLPVFEPATQITRLETRRVSRASADQRAGRAGRTEPGIAIRLWLAGQNAALEAFTPPEILASDLSGLALDLAAWGVKDPATLAFLDPPPDAAFTEAKTLLMRLGALDRQGDLTATGRMMRRLALPPRLAAMTASAASHGLGRQAAELAVLITEQGLGGTAVDLDARLARFRSERSERAQAARGLARRIADALPKTAAADQPVTAGRLLLHAFPDRIAAQRGARGRYVMANGRGGELADTDALARSDMLVVADLTGRAAAQRILSAASVTRAEIEEELPDAIVTESQCVFDTGSRQVRARRVTRLGAIILEEQPLPRPNGEEAARALAEGIRNLGLDALPFSKAARQLRERIGFLHRMLGEPWPDMGDAALLAGLETWLMPFVLEPRGVDSIGADALHEGLMSLVPHEVRRELDKAAPTHFDSPAGNRHPIDYSGEEPLLTIRVQELFGLKSHPAIGNGRIPLVLELTSPAHRPIQTTRDLPGFWKGSWKDVRADMRGRYPKHPWPEDPAEAAPTARAKPRGT